MITVVLGVPELASDPRFATNQARFADAAAELCHKGRRLFSDFNRRRCIAKRFVEIQREVWNGGLALVSLPLFEMVMPQGRFEELAKRGADAKWCPKIESQFFS